MKRSYLIAAAIVVVVTLWMLSGVPAKPPAEGPAALAKSSAKTPTRVVVAQFEAAPMAREMTIHGSTRAKRSVTLRSEVAGRVVEVSAERGARVKAGEALLRLAADDRKELVAQARALLHQRELEYQASKSLQDKGLKAQSQLAEAFSLLESARAQLKSAELNLARATLTAPFDGVLQERSVEVGDYIKGGDPVALLLELDPMVVRGELAEKEVAQVALGMGASARLANGAVLEGRISYISAAASSETRSFTVEMEAPNGQGAPAGITAEIKVPLEEVSAHKLSPALLTLNDAGVMGVKGVNDSGVVEFHEVELLRADSEGMWLAGLPSRLRLITTGQGFVRAGDRVEVVEQEPKQDQEP
jgi:multidrug efflux system membrane fusion protein